MNAGIGRDPIPGLTRLSPDTACLRVCNGPCANRTFPLHQPRLIVGRSDPNTTADIDLGDCDPNNPPKVSRRHAELQWVEGELFAIDLGSTNGTSVDGQELKPTGDRQPSAPVKLKAGSKLRLGTLELEVIRHA